MVKPSLEKMQVIFPAAIMDVCKLFKTLSDRMKNIAPSHGTDIRPYLVAWRVMLLIFLTPTAAFSAGTSADQGRHAKSASVASIHGSSQNELAKLGEQLFTDKRFSADGKTSCASCHQKNQCFTDRRPRAIGVNGQLGTRNTPTLVDTGLLSALFWDGRVSGLQEQARIPLTNPVEHGLLHEQEAARLVLADSEYARAFARVFNIREKDIDFSHLSLALATYQRTLTGGNSAFDKHIYQDDENALSQSESRGLKLFQGRAGCASCHTMNQRHALFTDEAFHTSPLGIPQNVNVKLATITARLTSDHEQNNADAINRLVATDPEIAALGRFVVTLDPKDIGKFKTPSLRNVARTAPYMHDGSVPDLAKAVELELYGRGDLRYPIILTTSEKEDLVNFLNALTSSECFGTSIN